MEQTTTKQKRPRKPLQPIKMSRRVKIPKSEETGLERLKSLSNAK